MKNTLRFLTLYGACACLAIGGIAWALGAQVAAPLILLGLLLGLLRGLLQVDRLF